MTQIFPQLFLIASETTYRNYMLKQYELSSNVTSFLRQ